MVEEDVLLLRKADRGVRLRALPHLEGLVRQILSTLEDQVRQVEATPVGQVAGDEAKPSDEAEPAGG